MKKFSALLLAVLLLFCAAASADGAAIDYMGRFQIRCSLPDGWHQTILSQNDLTLEGNVLPDAEDPAGPVMNIFISFNESYAAVSDLKQLADADLEVIKAGFSEENTVSFDIIETDSGIRLLVIRETGEDQDFLDFYTIWQGHEIELTLFPGEAAPMHTLSEEQISTCLEYIRTLEISPAA